MKKYTVFLLIVLSATAYSDELTEVHEWLRVTWKEVMGHCPVEFKFSQGNRIIISSINSKSEGSYTISKAVGIPKNSICRERQCYEMGYEIVISEHKEGCGPEYGVGPHKSYLNNFHKKSEDVLIWGEDIVFFRAS